MTMKNKKFALFAILAIVAISIPVAYAVAQESIDDYCDPAPTSTIKAKYWICNDLHPRLTALESETKSPVYEVKVSKTALSGERFDIEARCIPGDALLGNYVSFNVFPETNLNYGNGGVMDENPGNVSRQIQVGWFMNLDNINISTTFPITGEVSILCIQHP